MYHAPPRNDKQQQRYYNTSKVTLGNQSTRPQLQTCPQTYTTSSAHATMKVATYIYHRWGPCLQTTTEKCFTTSNEKPEDMPKASDTHTHCQPYIQQKLLRIIMGPLTNNREVLCNSRQPEDTPTDLHNTLQLEVAR